jgi:uncharacterized protein (DUF2236 family)
LAETLQYRGDPGLFGPSSVTWPVVGDAAAFLGGIRALLVQAAHAEVVAGVADHSRYRQDPLGRLSRTSAYVTATAYGAMPEVEDAVAVVRRMHQRVTGVSHRGIPYAAGEPEMAAWVHNALTDSFLVAYQTFGPGRLSATEADQFVAEQTAVGALLDSDPMPTTAVGLAGWLEHHPDAVPSPGMEETVAFLRSPPLPFVVRMAYRVLFLAAAATVTPRLRRTLGVHRVPGAITIGRLFTRFLRWSLGSSPSWHVALLRVDAPVPPGLFHRLPPLS